MGRLIDETEIQKIILRNSDDNWSSNIYIDAESCMKEYAILLLDQVYERIKHGDEEHMKWLKDKCEELKNEL